MTGWTGASVDDASVVPWEGAVADAVAWVLVSPEDVGASVDAWVWPVFTLTVVSDGDSLGAEVDDVEASLVVDPLVLEASEPLVLLAASELADDSPVSPPVSAPVLSDAPPVTPESPVESALLVWLALVLSELPLSVDPSDEP